MLLDLFLSFLQVGLFSVGGGYAAMPLIQSQAVVTHGWLTMTEFTDLITIAEMTPGPIAINAATFVGVRLAGLGGALAATMGCVLPSCILASLLAYVYKRYHGVRALNTVLSCLRPVVVALIAGAGISILQTAVFIGGQVGLSSVNVLGVLLFCGALLALRVLRASPIAVMGACGGVGLLWHVLSILIGGSV